MKKLLMLTALALTACAPGLTGGKGDPTPPTLTTAVLFAPGAVDRTLNSVVLHGLKVRVNDPEHCKVDSDTQATCTYTLKLPAYSKGFALPATGVLVVEATYTNPDGQTYTIKAD